MEADVLIIGSGAAGLTAALQLAQKYKVAVLAKGALSDGATAWAQGGIAAVLEPGDTFESHIEDTMVAGAGLNNRATVEFVVENAPEAIERLAKLGVPFNPDGNELHLTREGGHSHRRIVHVDDATGWAVQVALEAAAKANPNIILVPDMVAIDLIIRTPSGTLFHVGPYPRRLCAQSKNREGRNLHRTRDDPGKRRGRADVPVFNRAARGDGRRHRHGVARRMPDLKYGIHAVPSDLPL